MIFLNIVTWMCTCVKPSMSSMPACSPCPWGDGSPSDTSGDALCFLFFLFFRRNRGNILRRKTDRLKQLLTSADTYCFLINSGLARKIRRRPIVTKFGMWIQDSSRKGSNLNKFARPTQGGIIGDKNLKSPGNVMNCRENQYIF